MYIAAPIEGFFSFNPRVPTVAKIAFIIASAAAWAMFWGFYGRKSEAESLEQPA
jgi:hypothetical protein